MGEVPLYTNNFTPGLPDAVPAAEGYLAHKKQRPPRTLQGYLTYKKTHSPRTLL